MAAARRGAGGKPPAKPSRRKKVAAKARAKVKSGRTAARRRLAGGKRSTGAVVRKVRALAAAGVAAVKALKALPPPAPEQDAATTEEERIEAAKYQPRRAVKRVFETERFIFPESYGVNRVRLLVKDPEWLFAHWDMDPGALAAVRMEIGERAMALARLTLRLSDAVNGGSTVILLPRTARAWYIRADGTARSYRAELGFTLPSGEFHTLASSNVVGTPRVGPAPRVATARVRYDRSGRHVTAAGKAAAMAKRAQAGRMRDTRVVGKPESGEATAPLRGGASDTFRR
jgi:hypothetical protein